MDDGSGEFGRSAGSARRGTAQRLARRGDRVNGAIGPHPSPSGRIARTWSDTAKRLSLLAAATTVCASGAFAQTASEVLGPAAASGTTAARVVPLAEAQPPARIVVDPPLAEALARGVVVLQYRAENLRIVPVFGPAALAVSPRIGHLHVTVDDLPWDWADASGVPIIIQNLPPGPHRVLVELADANHHILDQRVVEFAVPDVGQRSRSTTAPASGQSDGEAAPIFGVKIPAEYRDWRLISVAHEEGNLNDLRAILGNDIAITAFREGKLPFPDGTIMARLAWSYVPLEESSKAFEDTLWSLSLSGAGVLAGTPDVAVDFELNPEALDEVSLPSSYLVTLPGYSTGLSDDEIAALIDDAFDSAIGWALTYDSSSGKVSLTDYSLFPGGTL